MVCRRQIGDYLVALRDPRTLRILFASALLIALNWLVYIYAIVSNHVLAASLGYYLNPLINVMLGMVFLGARLSRLQMLAVAIAAVGRSEARRVGNERVSPCRSRWSPYHDKKNQTT